MAAPKKVGGAAAANKKAATAGQPSYKGTCISVPCSHHASHCFLAACVLFASSR